jgi:hypothetical protein
MALPPVNPIGPFEDYCFVACGKDQSVTYLNVHQLDGAHHPAQQRRLPRSRALRTLTWRRTQWSGASTTCSA